MTQSNLMGEIITFLPIPNHEPLPAQVAVAEVVVLQPVDAIPPKPEPSGVGDLLGAGIIIGAAALFAVAISRKSGNGTPAKDIQRDVTMGYAARNGIDQKDARIIARKAARKAERADR
jgi:hypothetical protein